MTTLVVMKALKYVGLLLLASGIFGALTMPKPTLRSLSIHRVGMLGFLLVWLAGYGVMKKMGYTMKQPWISGAILASLVAYGAGLAAVHRSPARALMGALASGALFLSLGLMVFRSPFQPIAAGVIALVGAVLGWYIVKQFTAHQEEAPEEAIQQTRQWFITIARIEGITLLVLFGIYMPLKYGAGIQLDGGNGWVGWLHGIFQMVYVAGLLVLARASGWSLKITAGGFVASLVPFGTFLFERKVLHKTDEAPASS